MVGKCNCQNVSVLCMALCWKKATKLFCFQRLWLFKVNFQSVTEWKGGSLCCQIENFHWHFDWMLWSSHIRSPVAEASIDHHQGGSEESVEQYQILRGQVTGMPLPSCFFITVIQPSISVEMLLFPRWFAGPSSPVAPVSWHGPASIPPPSWW